PDHGAEYGRSDLSLLVALDDPAIERALSAGEGSFFEAYGLACLKGYRAWSANRRALLERTSLQMDRTNSPAQEAQRLEAWAFYDARRVNKTLATARTAGPGPQRADAFRKLAKIDGLEFRAVVALALLGGDSARRELTFT